MSYPPPITISAPFPSSTTPPPATLIFLHGLGDDAQSYTDLVSQFHTAGKLPHLKWILPNAPQNLDAMASAWFTPKSFSPIPMPKRAGECSEDEDGEDDVEGMMKSVEYVCGIIDVEVASGVPVERVMVGGFSQGCVIALLVGLMSRYKGQLGGAVGLSGYLPLVGKVKNMVEARQEEEKRTTKWFLVHGSRDQLVPRRFFTKYSEKMTEWEGERVQAKMYEGLGHTISGAELRDLCAWLEGILGVG